MNKGRTSSEPERRLAPAPSPARKSILIVTALIGLGAIGLVLVATRHPEPVGRAARPPEDKQVPAASGANTAASDWLPAPLAATADTAAPPEPDRAAIARQLVKSLSEVNVQPGQLTPQKAGEWKENLEQLVEQGTAAVPPLQEFFQTHADVRFDSGPGTNLLEEPTLRIAFIEVLFNVPAPDNVNLQEQILRTTTDPEEVALLAHQLELQEPGQDRDLIVLTARVALEQARTGQWPGRDTGPLLKILKKYGDDGAK
jgi:hypothetical protein